MLVYIIINSTLVSMRESITQEFDYGCGIACYAFALQLTYKQAADKLGEEQASSIRFWVQDLTKALNKSGKQYESRHFKPYLYKRLYKEGTIVLIRRSKNLSCWSLPNSL